MCDPHYVFPSIYRIIVLVICLDCQKIQIKFMNTKSLEQSFKMYFRSLFFMCVYSVLIYYMYCYSKGSQFSCSASGLKLIRTCSDTLVYILGSFNAVHVQRVCKSPEVPNKPVSNMQTASRAPFRDQGQQWDR